MDKAAPLSTLRLEVGWAERSEAQQKATPQRILAPHPSPLPEAEGAIEPGANCGLMACAGVSASIAPVGAAHGRDPSDAMT